MADEFSAPDGNQVKADTLLIGMNGVQKTEHVQLFCGSQKHGLCLLHVPLTYVFMAMTDARILDGSLLALVDSMVSVY